MVILQDRAVVVKDCLELGHSRFEYVSQSAYANRHLQIAISLLDPFQMKMNDPFCSHESLYMYLSLIKFVPQAINTYLLIDGRHEEGVRPSRMVVVVHRSGSEEGEQLQFICYYLFFFEKKRSLL